MLILTRRSTESIFIGPEIQVKILSVNGGQVRIGIQAPKELSIHREELYRQLDLQKIIQDTKVEENS